MRSWRECAPAATSPRPPSLAAASPAASGEDCEPRPRRTLSTCRVHTQRAPRAHTSPRRDAGARASAVHGLRRSVENELVEIEVQPAAELKPGMFDTASELEADPRVERDADVVGGIDAANHVVILLKPGSRDDGLEQHGANASSAAVLVHIHGVLDGVFVGRPVSERTVRRKTEQTAPVIDCATHRILSLLL